MVLVPSPTDIGKLLVPLRLLLRSRFTRGQRSCLDALE